MTMPTTDHPQQHQDWRVDALWRALSPLLPDIGIEVLERTESTNTVLLDRVRSDSTRSASNNNIQSAQAGFGRRAHDLQPCLLVAEHQTRGRGRMGRQWQSGADGSLTFSLGLPLALSDWSGLSLAVGCAIAEALDPLERADQAPRLQLKWPNDIWLMDGSNGRKLGGILIETVPAGAQRMVVVGVGLNVSELPPNASFSNSTMSDFAPLAPLAAQFNTGFAALDELWPELSPPEVLARIAPALVQALLDFTREGFEPWQARFARRDLSLNKAVSAGAIDGIARGVNSQGELLVQTPAGIQVVSGGEVSLRLLRTPSSN